MKSRTHDEAMAELFRDEPDFAIGLINDIFEDGEAWEVLTVLRKLVLTAGGRERLAERGQIGLEQLDHILAAGNALTLAELLTLMHALGLRLAVSPRNVAEAETAAESPQES